MDEFLREQVRGLGAASEDIVDNVIVAIVLRSGCACSFDEDGGVFNDGGVVGGEGEIFHGEVVDDWVDLYSGRVDTVGNERRRGCTDSKATMTST